MENTSIRDAIAQQLAANKKKASTPSVERHPELFEQTVVEKETKAYDVGTTDLNAALRRGLEKIERLREVQATTRENQLKAAGGVNRGFREQSTWWLPKQELPKTWFPAKVAARSPPVSPQQQQQQQQQAAAASPSGAVATPNNGAQCNVQRGDGIGDGEVDMAPADGSASAAGAQAKLASPRGTGPGSDGGAATPTSPMSPRTGWGRAAAAAARVSRVSTPGAIDSGSDGGGGGSGGGGGGGGNTPVFRSPAGIAAMAATVAAASSGGGGGGGGAFGRVAWALSRAKRGHSSSGADRPVLYDGGGDEAVPGQGPAVPIHPPPGYPRYTVNLFEVQQQMRRQAAANGLADGAAGESLEIEDDDEEDEEEENESSPVPQGRGVYGGTPFPGSGPLGTGFRALADEYPAAQLRHLAMTSAPAIAAAAAKVAASNAEARGFNASRANFGMVGRVGVGASRVSGAKHGEAPPLTTAEPTAVLDTKPPAGADQQGAAPGTSSSTPSSPTRPKHTLGRQNSCRGSSPHQHRILSANPRMSSPGVLMSSGRGGAAGAGGIAAVIAAMAAAAADQRAAAAAADPVSSGAGGSPGGPPLTPTPPPQQPDGKPSGAGLRAGRVHRTVLHCESSLSPRPASAGTSPVAAAAAARGRLGSASFRSPGIRTCDGAPGDAAVVPAAAAARAPAAAARPQSASVVGSGIRSRIRVLSVPTPGEPEEDSRRMSNPGMGAVPGLSRCLLAPSSPHPAPTSSQPRQAPQLESSNGESSPWPTAAAAAAAAGAGAAAAAAGAGAGAGGGVGPLGRGPDMAVPSPPAEPPPERPGCASRTCGRQAQSCSVAASGRSLAASPTPAAAAAAVVAAAPAAAPQRLRWPQPQSQSLAASQSDPTAVEGDDGGDDGSNNIPKADTPRSHAGTLSPSSPSSPNGSGETLPGSQGAVQPQYDRGSPAAAALQAARSSVACGAANIGGGAAAVAGSVLHGAVAGGGGAAAGPRMRRTSTPAVDVDGHHGELNPRFSRMCSTQPGCLPDGAATTTSTSAEGALSSMIAQPSRMSLSGLTAGALVPTLNRRPSGIDCRSSLSGSYFLVAAAGGGGGAAAAAAAVPVQLAAVGGAGSARFGLAMGLAGHLGGSISRAGSVSSVGILEDVVPASPSARPTWMGGGASFPDHRASGSAAMLHRRAAPCTSGRWFEV